MKESDFSSAFRTAMKKALPSAHIVRIENLVLAGAPDINVFYEREAWIETKMIKGRRIELRFSQASWFHHRIRAGGSDNIFVVARSQALTDVSVWRGPTILQRLRDRRMSKTKEGYRETDDSFVFDPGEPDWIFLTPYDWSRIAEVFFGTSA